MSVDRGRHSRSQLNQKASSRMHAAAGFSLIEVMIALLVLSVGLLGLAAMQATAVQYNHDAYLRSQATNLAYDIVDRMRANRNATLNRAYDGAAAFLDTPACPAAAGAALADLDVAAWRCTLFTALPLGNGRIDRNGASVTIEVRWDESRGVAAPEDMEKFEMTTSL